MRQDQVYSKLPKSRSHLTDIVDYQIELMMINNARLETNRPFLRKNRPFAP